MAPWLWYLGQYLIAADILPQLKPFGFAKYLNRAVLILVIVGLGPFLKHVGMSDREQFGIVPNPHWRRDLWVGVAVALAILLACGLVGVGLDYRKWTTGLPKVSTVFAVFAAAAVVSPLEEGLFRGVLLSALLRRYQLKVAIAVQAAIFASLHFLKPTKAYRSYAGEVEPWTGFELLPHFLSGFSQLSKLIAGWLTLRGRCSAGELCCGEHARFGSHRCPCGMDTRLKTLKLATRKENPPDLFTKSVMRQAVSWP